MPSSTSKGEEFTEVQPLESVGRGPLEGMEVMPILSRTLQEEELGEAHGHGRDSSKEHLTCTDVQLGEHGKPAVRATGKLYQSRCLSNKQGGGLSSGALRSPAVKKNTHCLASPARRVVFAQKSQTPGLRPGHQRSEAERQAQIRLLGQGVAEMDLKTPTTCHRLRSFTDQENVSESSKLGYSMKDLDMVGTRPAQVNGSALCPTSPARTPAKSLRVPLTPKSAVRPLLPKNALLSAQRRPMARTDKVQKLQSRFEGSLVQSPQCMPSDRSRGQGGKVLFPDR